MKNNELEINIIPKVSLITVCLNSAKTLRDTIESIIAQSYQNKVKSKNELKQRA